MVALSKVFQFPINRVHCSQNFMHAGCSCWQFFLSNSYHYTKSTAVYFVPILITPLLLKVTHLDRDVFKKALENYVLTVVSASGGSVLIFTCICLLRNCLGCYMKYTLTQLPTLLGMQVCWLYPKNVIGYFNIGTSQAMLEGVLRQSTNPLARLLLHSKAAQTLLFMINSAVILHYKRSHNHKGFWFIQPTAADVATPEQEAPADDDDEPRSSSCSVAHRGMTCSQFVLKGIQSYLYIGISVDVISMLLKGKVPKGSTGILSICWSKLKALRLNLTGFFALYVGIYRSSLCLLAKYQSNRADTSRHLIAALLGGLSYMCLSRVSIYMYSLILAIDCLWMQFCNKRTEKPNTFREMLKKVPFAHIATIFNMTYLVNAFVFNYEHVNSLGRGFLNAVTNNRIQYIHDFVASKDFDGLMKEAGKHAAKGFFR